MSEVKRYDLDRVLWREYDFCVKETGMFGLTRTTYRIEKPVAFFWAEGHTTHRVLDAEGILHLVPAPGFHGCVVRQIKEDGVAPVAF